MKITIITTVFNAENTIADCILSVKNQNYTDIEHIVVDGNSTDNTIKEICKLEHNNLLWVSEPDKGMYDGINKGLKKATGDVIGLLNADDFFADDTIVNQIAEQFNNNDIDGLYGDIAFIKKDNKDKVARYFSSSKFTVRKFKYGYMPAHPSFYVKKEIIEEVGYYKVDYDICADFEWVVRIMLNSKYKIQYIPLLMVKMRLGGKSNKDFKSILRLNKEIYRGCQENGIKTNLLNIYLKYFTKIFEFKV